MIIIDTNDQSYKYDIHSLVQAFYPNQIVAFDGDKKALANEEDEIITTIVVNIEDGSVQVEYQKGAYETSSKEVLSGDRSLDKNIIKKLLYKHLIKETNQELPWGTLTGIRPTKLAIRRCNLGETNDQILDYLKKEYLISDKKGRLSIEIARLEKTIIDSFPKDGYSLYIGIPFCPSVCAYCSFSSDAIANWKGRTDEYLAALYKDIEFAAESLRDKNLVSIYVGGGTPTTLTDIEINGLLSFINKRFNLSYLKEFSFEAGRPDSIDEGKLDAIKSNGVDRISINPQSFNANTLKAIGRAHSIEDIYNAYDMARRFDFKSINMDLIMGLPGEHEEDFISSLEEAISLDPENITVHSLAIKRASSLNENTFCFDANIMDFVINRLEKASLKPYYLYRQQQIGGNLENIGFSKPGFEGIYNIAIMEEIHSIIALGAGAASKYIVTSGLKPKRSENVKDITSYISRIDEMIDRKRKVLEEIGWL